MSRPVRQVQAPARFEEEEFEDDYNEGSEGETGSEVTDSDDEDFIVDDDEELSEAESSEEDAPVVKNLHYALADRIGREELDMRPNQRPAYYQIPDQPNQRQFLEAQLPKGYTVIKKVTEYYGVPKKVKSKQGLGSAETPQNLSTPATQPQPSPVQSGN